MIPQRTLWSLPCFLLFSCGVDGLPRTQPSLSDGYEAGAGASGVSEEEPLEGSSYCEDDTEPQEQNSSSRCDCGIEASCDGPTVAGDVCEAGTWDHDALPNTDCAPWKSCEPGWTELMAGSPLNDRLCGRWAWQTQINEIEQDRLSSVSVNSAGELIIASTARNRTRGMSVASISGDGDLLFSRNFAHIDASRVTVNSWGEVFVQVRQALSRVSIEDGSEIWRYDRASYGVRLDPTGNLAVLGINAIRLEDPEADGLQEPIVYFLDRTEGQVLREHTPLAPMDPGDASWNLSGVDAQGNFYLSLLNPVHESLTLFALNDSGQQKWKRSESEVLGLLHLGPRGQIYLGGGGRTIEALQDDSAETHWSTTSIEGAYDKLTTLTDGRLIAAGTWDTPSPDGNSTTIAELDPHDGAELWGMNLSHEAQRRTLFNVVGDGSGNVYIVGDDWNAADDRAFFVAKLLIQ